MTLSDAVLVLLLAERIHGNDDAVRRVAKSLSKKLPGRQRQIMYDLLTAKKPCELVRHIAIHIDD
ncbi:hypothetical protein NJC38_02865 [Pseudomonas sp. 21LCFQ010]|uniref:DUF7740 domain-containing protein n=1 Tax=Pseudomonas sp. 21LCFQ010 TaxID=2957506 RepID=UPI002097CDB9|nr:hypothetical protein [Pseudomonas sp. 21LCFQ010]MCO8161093.1 hypothetical protein [Pseudomonas sp. 21LCFQ010]